MTKNSVAICVQCVIDHGGTFSHFHHPIQFNLMDSIQIKAVLETCLYVDDLDQAERFYRDILGLSLFVKTPGRHLFFRCGAAMLLLFDPETTRNNEFKVNDSRIPQHGSTGPGHVAFAISESEMNTWRKRLVQNGVEIESEVDWPNGVHSIYFRDPSFNSLELTSPRIWNFDV